MFTYVLINSIYYDWSENQNYQSKLPESSHDESIIQEHTTLLVHTMKDKCCVKRMNTGNIKTNNNNRHITFTRRRGASPVPDTPSIKINVLVSLCAK